MAVGERCCERVQPICCLAMSMAGRNRCQCGLLLLRVHAAISGQPFMTLTRRVEKANSLPCLKAMPGRGFENIMPHYMDLGPFVIGFENFREFSDPSSTVC